MVMSSALAPHLKRLCTEQPCIWRCQITETKPPKLYLANALSACERRHHPSGLTSPNPLKPRMSGESKTWVMRLRYEKQGTTMTLTCALFYAQTVLTSTLLFAGGGVGTTVCSKVVLRLNVPPPGLLCFSHRPTPPLELNDSDPAAKSARSGRRVRTRRQKQQCYLAHSTLGAD